MQISDDFDRPFVRYLRKCYDRSYYEWAYFFVRVLGGMKRSHWKEIVVRCGAREPGRLDVCWSLASQPRTVTNVKIDPARPKFGFFLY